MRWMGAFVLWLAVVILWLPTLPATAADDWRVGGLVGLHAGTCIREGPGLSFRAHTTVPEDNWTVQVINGPRSGNEGKTWYDTSRKAAGDPSGGTGWVDASQTDRDCPQPEIGTGLTTTSNSVLDRVRIWWTDQVPPVRWAVALLVLLLLVGMGRRGSSPLLALLRALLVGLLLWWLFDQTRTIWQPTWTRLVGLQVPDLALLVGVLPLLGWALAFPLRRRAYRVR